MKKYVSIKLDVENINCMQTEYLNGIPSIVAYLSFVENILIKSDLIKNGRPKETIIGISSFKYSKDVIEKSSENIKIDGKTLKISPISRNQKGFLKTEIMFDLNTDEDSIVLKNKIMNTVFSLNFAGGTIKHFHVYISNNKDEGLIKLMPTFIINQEKEEISSLEQLFDLVMFNEDNHKDLDVIIQGYNFISEEIDSDRFRYNSVYGEPLLGLISKKALTKIDFESTTGWYFESNKNNIITKQKGV